MEEQAQDAVGLLKRPREAQDSSGEQDGRRIEPDGVPCFKVRPTSWTSDIEGSALFRGYLLMRRSVRRVPPDTTAAEHWVVSLSLY